MTFRDILSFTRIHTASLTMPVVMMAAILSGRGYVSILLFAVFALLFHAFGFALNNVADMEYDLNDPYKKHFPSVDGSVNVRSALMFILVGTVISTAYGVVIAPTHVGIIFLVAAVVFGIIYNFRNKTSHVAPVYISLSFSLLIPFVMWPAKPYLMLGFTAFAFVTMMYQIGVSGYLKDMEVDQYNLMAAMGTRLIGGVIYIPPRASVFALVLRLLTLFIGLSMVFAIGWTWIDALYYLGFVVINGVTSIISARMTIPQPWVRNTFLKRMSMIEVINYVSLAVLFGAIYGYAWMLFLIAFPIVWFVLFNRMFFGSTVYPKV